MAGALVSPPPWQRRQSQFAGKTGIAELPLPLVVRLEGPVAGLAADAHLGHGRVVAVGCLVIVFPQPGVVTTGAHEIPVHAASRPMSPFARAPVLAAINIEPLVRA